MSQNNQFNPDEFAKWFLEGVKETLQYRVRQTFDRQQLFELLKSKIPSRTELFHKAVKEALRKNGFEFEMLKQGDANFHVIRKPLRTAPENKKNIRRLIFVPGFGDSPTSWVAPFLFCKKQLATQFDEILTVDFPGYMGFLSHNRLVPSMEVLLNVVQMVCETYPAHVLVGHSLGGALAGRVAQRLVRPVEHLVLVSPSGLMPESDKKPFGEFILKMQQAPFEKLIAAIVHEPRRYYQLLKTEFEVFYSQAEITEFIESFRREHFIDPQHPFACERLSVIWGSEDGFVPAHWMRYWVECFGPYMDGYLIKNTGHLPQMECPKTMADLFKHILFSQPPSSPRGANAGTVGTLGTSEARWTKIVSQTKSFQTPQLPQRSEALLTYSK